MLSTIDSHYFGTGIGNGNQSMKTKLPHLRYLLKGANENSLGYNQHGLRSNGGVIFSEPSSSVISSEWDKQNN